MYVVLPLEISSSWLLGTDLIFANSSSKSGSKIEKKLKFEKKFRNIENCKWNSSKKTHKIDNYYLFSLPNGVANTLLTESLSLSPGSLGSSSSIGASRLSSLASVTLVARTYFPFGSTSSSRSWSLFETLVTSVKKS